MTAEASLLAAGLPSSVVSGAGGTDVNLSAHEQVGTSSKPDSSSFHNLLAATRRPEGPSEPSHVEPERGESGRTGHPPASAGDHGSQHPEGSGLPGVRPPSAEPAEVSKNNANNANHHNAHNKAANGADNDKANDKARSLTVPGQAGHAAHGRIPLVMPVQRPAGPAEVPNVPEAEAKPSTPVPMAASADLHRAPVKPSAGSSPTSAVERENRAGELSDDTRPSLKGAPASAEPQVYSADAASAPSAMDHDSPFFPMHGLEASVAEATPPANVPAGEVRAEVTTVAWAPRPDPAGPSSAGLNPAGSSSARPSSARPSSARPSSARPSSAGSSSAEAADQVQTSSEGVAALVSSKPVPPRPSQVAPSPGHRSTLESAVSSVNDRIQEPPPTSSWIQAPVALSRGDAPEPLEGVPQPVGWEPLLSGSSVASQLLSVLSPIQSAPGGEASVVLRLYPEGLGGVKATITTTPSSVAVSLVADTQAGHDALSLAMSQLHDHLERGSGRHTTVDLRFSSRGDGARGGGPSGRQEHSAGLPASIVGASANEGTADEGSTAAGEGEPSPLRMLGASRHQVDVKL